MGAGFIVVGVIITASQKTLTAGASAWTSALIGVGSSVVASAIVVRILSGETLPLMANTGVRFVGSRSSFESTFRPSTSATAWDAWIERTPRGGNLVVIGKKNFQWVAKSWPAIIKVLRKSIPVTFVFMGMTEDEIRTNVSHFLEKAKQVDPSGLDAAGLSMCSYIPPSINDVPTALADTGYYWNGCDLMAKVYVQNGENYECPIIVFTAPGVSQAFTPADFDPAVIPLANAEALIQVARAMGRVLEDSQPIPFT